MRFALGLAGCSLTGGMIDVLGFLGCHTKELKQGPTGYVGATSIISFSDCGYWPATPKRSGFGASFYLDIKVFNCRNIPL